MAAGAAIGAGANLISSLFGNAARKKEASRQRAWNERMWHMENAYNTPEAQMARLKQAGLNPNLVYGQGSVGNAAGSVNSYQKPDIETPDLNPLGQMLQYVGVEAKQAQADNMRQQTETLKSQQALNEVKALTETANASSASTKAYIDKRTRGQKMNLIQRTLEKLSAEKTLLDQRVHVGHQTLDSQVKAIKNDASVKGFSAELHKLHVDMRKQGIEPGDKIYFRLIQALASKFGINLDSLKEVPKFN